MYMGTLIGIVFFSSLYHILIFISTTAVVLCFGHSLGMHRRLIHNSFECPLWFEYVLVYLGTLVGLGGPITMVYTHDSRDWAQRLPNCHDYFAHRQSFFKDAWWQMHCDLTLEKPPQFTLESRISNSVFYRFIERTWMLQQLPWVFIGYYFGGWGLVLWAVCARITACVTGHWLVGYFAHRQGHRDWHVNNAGVQGYNISAAALISFGESWHNNHHAFPGSAKMGLYKGQADPGWWVLKVLQYLRLATHLRTPEQLPAREELQAL